MTAVIFKNVSKNFSIRDSLTIKDLVLGIAGHRPKSNQFKALDAVTFRVEHGESVALLGHNGSGKSTTLKLLAGVMRPSFGEIYTRGRVAPLLELGSGFHPDLTGKENIFLNGAVLGIARNELRSRFDEIVEYAGVEKFLDTPIKFYSSGMSMRLGFSIAMTMNPEILLLDEVLAIGDAEFQDRSLSKLREFREAGATTILVTHDLTAAKGFCDRALVLDHGRIVFDGNIDDMEFK